jgi:subtilase family serine protease
MASTLTASLALLLAHAPAARAATAVTAPAADLLLALPLRNEAELESLVSNQGNPKSPLFHHFLSPAQFRAAYGPSAAQLQAAAGAMRAAGFTVTGSSSQGIKVHGSAAAVTSTFGVHVGAIRTASGMRLVSKEAVHLPAALAALGATVIGLENLPRKHIHSRIAELPDNRNPKNGRYWFTDLKQAYTYLSFKTGLTGKGVTIGIVIDSAVNPDDLKNYFAHENFTALSGGVPAPSIATRLVLNGAPVSSPTDPYNPNGDGLEAALDMEQSLGSAPGANGIIYDIPDLSDAGIIAGYIDVVEFNEVDLVSSSFGGCELGYFPAYNNGQDFTGILKTYHSIFLQGNAQGITFLASSGDEAGKECPAPAYFNELPTVFVPSIGYPAGDPNVVAVGGTNLVTTPPSSPTSTSLTSKYVSENAYGDPEVPYDPYGAFFPTVVNVSGGVWGSGSGPSAFWTKPHYQTLVNTKSKFRTIPDVSMQMGGCPRGLAITVVIGGANTCGYAPPLYDHAARSSAWALITDPIGVGISGYVGLIGTSASSPEFAGLLSIKAQSLNSRLGNANELIYALAAANDALPFHFFRQGIPGYNGVVVTTASESGYSPILGVGTPYTENFLGFPSDPLAGNPQTPSNP